MRPVGWPKELRRYAAEMDHRPFEWGEADCVSVVRGAIAIVLGEDPFDWEYTTERGARRVWNRLGGPGAALEAIGAVEVPVNFAMQGDVLVNRETVDVPANFAIAVGSGVLSASPDAGVYWLSGLPATECWRLPGGSRVGVPDGE